MLPADDVGVVGHTQKTQAPMSSAKWKKEKCISPVSSVKCLGKKITWHGTSAIVWAPKRCKTCHFTSHMNKDSIWVYNYLLAVRIIQNFMSAPILDVPSPVANSSSHLMTCHFPFWTSVFSWKSHVMCKFDHLFPCHLSKKWKNTCPLGRRITPMSCVKKKTIAKSIHKSHVMCQNTSAKSAAKSRVICAYYKCSYRSVLHSFKLQHFWKLAVRKSCRAIFPTCQLDLFLRWPL